jgi:hypothetical protein
MLLGTLAGALLASGATALDVAAYRL